MTIPRAHTLLALSLAGCLQLVASGCDTTETFVASPCDVTLTKIKPESVWAGDRASVLGRPFTSAYDTAVYVGSSRATVTEVLRVHCQACDDCIDSEGCTGCDDCDSCDPICSDCWESVTFEVPELLSSGETSVRIYNRHGESNSLPLLIRATSSDSGLPDSGADSLSDSALDTGLVGDTSDSGGDSAAPDSDSATDSGPTQ